MERIVAVPYEDYSSLVKDSADKTNIIQLLKTKFPDDTCQLIAIKSLLGIEEDEEPIEPPITEPTDPDPSDPIGGDPTP